MLDYEQGTQVVVDGGAAIVLAKCLAGYFPVGGGVEKMGLDPDREEITGSHPYNNGQSTGWFGESEPVEGGSILSVRIKVWAICVHPKLVFNDPGLPE